MKIERITNFDTMRQVAVLLDRQVRSLTTLVRDLADENARLKGQDARSIQREMEAFKELLAQRERMIFGEKSEKRPGPESPSSEHLPRRGHGPRVQPSLPILDVIHELDAADRICPKCGGELVEMAGQTEDSEEITVIERCSRRSRRT